MLHPFTTSGNEFDFVDISCGPLGLPDSPAIEAELSRPRITPENLEPDTTEFAEFALHTAVCELAHLRGWSAVESIVARCFHRQFMAGQSAIQSSVVA